MPLVISTPYKDSV